MSLSNTIIYRVLNWKSSGSRLKDNHIPHQRINKHNGGVKYIGKKGKTKKEKINQEGRKGL